MEGESNDSNLLLTSEALEEDEIIIEQPETSCGKIKCITTCIKNITLEPCVFMYFLAMSMEGIMFSEIMLQKTCLVYFNYSASMCANISQHKEEQILVETKANQLLMYTEIIHSLPTVIVVLFIGSWSDKHGRKIPLILSFIGSTGAALIIWVNLKFWSASPVYLLLSAVPKAFFGGLSCFMMAAYSYISDISDLKSRTTRIALVDTFLILGPCCGLLLSNVTKAHLGFSGTYLTTTAVYISCIFYISFRIQETRGRNANTDLDEELLPKSGTIFQDLFDYRNLRDTFRVTFKRRENNGRAKIILLMISICVMVFSFSEDTSKFLYTKLKFGWEYEQFVYWFVATIGGQFVGLTLLFPLLSYKLEIRDEVLALVGCVSVMASGTLEAFATSGVVMYIGGGIGFMGGFSAVISRSMISKVVPGESSGKVFSVLAVFESLLPLASSPAYTFVYNATILFFPGMFMLITVAIHIVSTVIFMVLYCLNNRDQTSPFTH